MSHTRPVTRSETYLVELQREFPGLKITVDPTLHSGDCLVRSRFGVVDARGSTRLRALQDSLAHA